MNLRYFKRRVASPATTATATATGQQIQMHIAIQIQIPIWGTERGSSTAATEADAAAGVAARQSL